MGREEVIYSLRILYTYISAYGIVDRRKYAPGSAWGPRTTVHSSTIYTFAAKLAATDDARGGENQSSMCGIASEASDARNPPLTVSHAGRLTDARPRTVAPMFGRFRGPSAASASCGNFAGERDWRKVLTRHFLNS